MKLSDFILNIGQPVPYYPALAKIFGVKAAVFLCRFAWWHGRQADAEGWIFKTQDEITDETGMSQKEQETARKILKASAVIEERIDRLNHRQFYRVNFDALNAAWDKWLGEFPETDFGSLGKPTLVVSTKPTLVVSSTTEDTQKTRTEGTACSHFQKPSIEEVKLAMAKAGLASSEVGAFFDYYESNGWRVGRNPMKSWQGAVGNWARRKREFGGNRFGGAVVEPSSETPAQRDARMIREASC